MKNLRQRGELALTLSLLGIFISLVGIGIGSSMTRSVQQSSSQAQSLFTYKSTLEIRNESGQVINWEPDFTWDNAGAGSGLKKGDLVTPPSPLAQIIYDATKNGVEKSLQGYPATVVIRIPEQKYEIVSAFCEDIYGDTCTKSKITNDNRTRSNLVIANGAEIKYGVVVRLKSNPQPTSAPTSAPTVTQTPNACPISGSECAPRNVEISNITSRTIDINWDLPQGCAGFKQGSDYWIDVERPGESIVCVAEGGSDGNKQCVLGKTTGFTPGRQLDTNSEEFRKRAWDENRRYDVKVYTHNASPSCVNTTPGVGSFTYEVAQPTTAPTDTPTGKLQCNRPCIYSEPPQAPSNKPRCWRGACPDNQSGCGGGIAEINRGCTYAGNVCGINQEVDCNSGEDIGKKSDPKPTGATVTPVPTGKPNGNTINLKVDTHSSYPDFYDSIPLTVIVEYMSRGERVTKSINRSDNFILQFDQLVVDDEIGIHFQYNVSGFDDSHSNSIRTIRGRYNQKQLLDKNFLVKLLDIEYELSRHEDFTHERILARPHAFDPYFDIAVIGELRNYVRDYYFSLTKEDASYYSPYDDNGGNEIETEDGHYTEYPSLLEFPQKFVDGAISYVPDNNKRIPARIGSKQLGKDINERYGVGVTYDNFSKAKLLIQLCQDCKHVRIIETGGDSAQITFTYKKISNDNFDVVLTLEPRDSVLLLIDSSFNSQFILSDSDSIVSNKSTLDICQEDNCIHIPITDGKYDNQKINSFLMSNKGAHIGCTIVGETGKSSNCPEVMPSNIQPMYLLNADIPSIVGETDLADVDDDGTISASDLANVLSGYGTPDGDINGDKMTNALDFSIIQRWFGEDVIKLGAI